MDAVLGLFDQVDSIAGRHIRNQGQRQQAERAVRDGPRRRLEAGLIRDPQVP
jgi:hypothetical protein